jgi:predicted TIM-barrel fold metal-dependent hydrolase
MWSSLAQSAGAPPERLIDMHMHAWELPPNTGEFRATLADAFERFHLERGLITGPEAAIIAAVSLDPTRLLGGAADGAGSVLPPLAVLRDHVQAGRLVALGEIDAAWDGEPITTARLDDYWMLADSLGMPVGVFTGIAPPGTQTRFPHYRTELGRPHHIEAVLEAHPGLRVYLMQAGWPYRDETIAVMSAHPEVYADLGNLAGNPAIPQGEACAYLRALMRAGLGKRLMFGSGLSLDQWPVHIGSAIAVIQDAPFLSPVEREDIFFGNAARFLRLDGPSRKTTDR